MADNLLTFEFDKALLPVNKNVANQFDNYDEKSFMNISDCQTPWWNGCPYNCTSNCKSLHLYGFCQSV